MMKLLKYFVPLIFFGLYVFNLCPAISPYRDSGDLIAAANTLGIAHPPGYPLMTLLGKIFIVLLPFGNIAWRMNLFSAVSAGLALYFFGSFLELFLSRYSSDRKVVSLFSIAGEIFLGSSICFWRLAQVSEMYALNSLVVSGLLFLVFYRTFPKPEGKNFLLASFIFGLGLGNHPMLLFFLPVLLESFFRLKNYSRSFILLVFLFLFLGFSIYFWLPLRSSSYPLIDWGHPTTFTRFFRLITRADYGGLKLHPQQSHFNFTFLLVLKQILLYGKSCLLYLGLPGSLLGLLGIWDLPAGLVGCWLISGPVFVLLANLPVEEVTTLPILEPHLIMSLMFLITALVFSLFRFYFKKKVLILLLSVFIAGYVFYSGFAAAKNRDNFSAYDYGRNLLRTVEPNGIIFDPDDPTAFITRYFQVGERKRPDIKLVIFFRTRWGYLWLRRTYPELFAGAGDLASSQQLLQYLFEKVSKNFPIYAELSTKFLDYPSSPYGLLVRQAKNKNDTGKYFTDLLDFYVIRFPEKVSDFFTKHIFSYYAFSSNNSGVLAMDRKDFFTARKLYWLALSFQPDLVAAISNLGTLAYYQEKYLDAVRYYQRAVNLQPDEPKNIYNLGLAWQKVGELEKAKNCFQKITGVKIYYPPAANELGLIELNQKRYAPAIKIFTELTARYPHYQDAWYNLGLAYQLSGNKEEAQRCFAIYQQLLNR